MPHTPKVKTSSATCGVWDYSRLGVSRPPPRGSWRWRRRRQHAPPPSTPDTRSQPGERQRQRCGPLATSHGAKRRRGSPERRSWVCRDRRREARGDGGASAAKRRLPQRPTFGRGWLELLEASCLTRQSLLTTRVEGRVDMLALGSCDAHTPVARIQRWWRYAARRAKESVPPRACHRERAT